MPSVSSIRPVCVCVCVQSINDPHFLINDRTNRVNQDLFQYSGCLVHTFEGISWQQLERQRSCLDHSLQTGVSFVMILL